MRAAYYTEQGPSTVLRTGELEIPALGHGEVLVRVHASGINPSDWKARSGSRGSPMPFQLIVPHSDGAGVIVDSGPGTPDRRGERVWLWNAQWKRAQGTAAEFAALPSAQAVHLPEGTSFEQGACLGIPAVTAFQAVRLAEVTPRSTVLVAGGAGAVGHYAIQFAKRRGATVLTTVSGGEKRAHALAAGADVVINYRSDDIAGLIANETNGRGVDAVIEVDLAANAGLYREILRPRGRVVVYGNSGSAALLPALWLMRNSVSIHPFLVYDLDAAARAAALRGITEALLDRSLVHTVAATFPLEDVARAHAAAECGEMIGSVVLALVCE